MNDPKSQIVEKLRSATNILVTVSANPSVDQLSACIALTLLLGKYKKNATAVFSGKVPGVLNFLNPKDTLEKNTDSLRDFIIALDKSKADKLRYKVEDDVVKIFITPYRTNITQTDLKYSAGDFNVDVIVALGVQHQQDLDTAITAHGRIFHDAVVVSMNNLPNGDFGVVNWEDLEVSSLSELVANLSEALDPTLLDGNIATALLTGIVAETSRFSNDKTHPRTMAVSSKLLEAGADQQLVNTQLQDLIGTIVTLEAGTEIKPDKNRVEEHAVHNDVEEELIIDEHGTLLPINSDAPAAEAPPVEVKPEEAKVESATPQPANLPEFTDQPTPASTDLAPAAASDIELPIPAAAEPAVVPDAQPAIANQPEPSQPADVPGDADTARQAIENALGASGGSQTQQPVDFGTQAVAYDNPVSLTPAAPADAAMSTSEPQVAAPEAQPELPAAPVMEPIAANQPSYANPSTTTEYQMPAVPEHEPAPLGMSPADQAFTMPMPPNSSMPAPVSPPAFPGAAGEPVQPAGPVPPPLPPPMMPADFSSQPR